MAFSKYYFTQIPTYEKDNSIQHPSHCFLLCGNESNWNVTCERKETRSVSKYLRAYFFYVAKWKTTIHHW
jgi:hypothetical protein